jgi:hypothetical protein
LVLDGVGALLEGDEGRDRLVGAVAQEHGEVREAAHEDRVAGTQQIGRGCVEISHRDDERGRVLAPVRPRVRDVDPVEHHLHLGSGPVDLGVAVVDHGARDAVDEPLQSGCIALPVARERVIDDATSFGDPRRHAERFVHVHLRAAGASA